MPTYQYSCTECGHFFEQFQTFSEDSLSVCPACEGQLRKVYNAVGVVFKGSGFYRTDSRSDSRSGSSGDSSASSSSETKSNGSSGGDSGGSSGAAKSAASAGSAA